MLNTYSKIDRKLVGLVTAVRTFVHLLDNLKPIKKLYLLGNEKQYVWEREKFSQHICTYMVLSKIVQPYFSSEFSNFHETFPLNSVTFKVVEHILVFFLAIMFCSNLLQPLIIKHLTSENKKLFSITESCIVL